MAFAPSRNFSRLLVHDLLVLGGHGLAQNIGLAHREPADGPRDPQHLLLVADDPVGFLEDRLQGGVEICDRLLAELGLDELGDERHRARAVERDDSREFPARSSA